jgi:L-ascorbate metabolism protein UlaG (beta-lactamase superfamily)
MSANRREVQLTLFGGPTVLIEWEGVSLLTDPTFDDAGGSYPSGSIVLNKTSGPARSVESLPHVDAVLLSHDQHSDNLDQAGRELLTRVPLVLTTPEAAGRLGPPARGLKRWESSTISGPEGAELRISGTPARHGPAGIEPIAGPVTGFYVEDSVGTGIYVTGDTVFFDGVAETARRFQPSLVVAFAGAARTRGPFDLTLSVSDLLELAAVFPSALIVPVHIDGWAHFTQGKTEIQKGFSALGLENRLAMLEPGETRRFSVSKVNP